ncbi:MAG: hypothetical protein K2P26_01135, partial [Oscillospiraceae bacterium]|nr:hypothetical protein [Oscillospiraceae bacterium]
RSCRASGREKNFSFTGAPPFHPYHTPVDQTGQPLRSGKREVIFRHFHIFDIKMTSYSFARFSYNSDIKKM